MENGEPKPSQKEKDPEKAKYIGLAVKEAEAIAKKEKRRFRVSNLDGEPMILTKDFRPRRVNATVVKGIVTAVKFG